MALRLFESESDHPPRSPLFVVGSVSGGHQSYSIETYVDESHLSLVMDCAMPAPRFAPRILHYSLVFTGVLYMVRRCDLNE